MKLKYIIFASVLSFTTMSCADSNELFAPEPVMPAQKFETGSTDDSSEDEGMSAVVTVGPLTSTSLNVNTGL